MRSKFNFTQYFAYYFAFYFKGVAGPRIVALVEPVVSTTV